MNAINPETEIKLPYFKATESPVLAAPMAGITEKIYRGILREAGADYCFTEMVCAKALLYENEKTFGILDIEGQEDFCGIQLFGADPLEMAKAAELACKAGAEVIDVNMGCPVPKIVNNHEGSALLKDIPLAVKIIKAMLSAVDVPVTVKLRKGFDGGNEGIELAKAVEQAGVSCITVHGRDRVDYYGGKSDTESIAAVKKAVKIPVIANGDIFTPQDAARVLRETGADGIMVARGIEGNPWLITDIKRSRAGETLTEPTLEDKIRLNISQLEAYCQRYGEYTGIRLMRKFNGWYVRGFRGSAALRDKLNHLEKQDDIKCCLLDFLQEYSYNKIY